jgi:hypothetical protein
LPEVKPSILRATGGAGLALVTIASALLLLRPRSHQQSPPPLPTPTQSERRILTLFSEPFRTALLRQDWAGASTPETTEFLQMLLSLEHVLENAGDGSAILASLLELAEKQVGTPTE